MIISSEIISCTDDPDNQFQEYTLSFSSLNYKLNSNNDSVILNDDYKFDLGFLDFRDFDWF